MLELNQHCFDLSRLFYELDYCYGGPLVKKKQSWEPVANYLSIAASIYKIEFYFDYLYDSCWGCPEPDYEAIDIEYSKVVLEITFFMFIWASIESVIDIIIPIKDQKEGKIKAACRFIRGESDQNDPLHFYQELVNLLKAKSLANETFSPFFVNLDKNEFYQTPGEALELIYKIRNSFAHGFLKFPINSMAEEVESDVSEIISICSKLVLLSMQLILLAYFKEINLHLDLLHNYEEDIEITTYLKRIHYVEL